MELTEICKDVYACIQEDRGLGWSNSGFVNLGGGMVVDTFWDLPLTRELISNYASVSSSVSADGSPAARVVNTHHNGDHCWGNQLFSSAEIIGHRLCADAMRADATPALFAALQAGGAPPPGLEAFLDSLGAFDFSGIEITPPTTLVEDKLELSLDGCPVEIIYLGPAHTIGDVVVHLPAQKVVYVGDLVFRKCTPIGWEGSYAQWQAALEAVCALEPEVVVPGHGPVTDTDGVREMGEYLSYIRDKSKQCFDSGMSEQEAARGIDLGPYAGWTEPERIVFNVHRAYREFRGEPFDAPIDAIGLLSQMAALRG